MFFARRCTARAARCDKYMHLCIMHRALVIILIRLQQTADFVTCVESERPPLPALRGELQIPAYELKLIDWVNVPTMNNASIHRGLDDSLPRHRTDRGAPQILNLFPNSRFAPDR